MKDIALIFLGTGTSTGVPEIGCSCKVCRSKSTKNKRFRSSLLIRYDNKNILIDASCELRLQLIREGVSHVDAVWLTHAHADHILGLDDLRVLTHEEPIPLYGTKETIKEVQRAFPYLTKAVQYGGPIPKFKFINIKDKINIFGKIFIPVRYNHGPLKPVGFRLEDFAYITDIKTISIQEMKKLFNLKLIILDALRYREHPTHFSISEAIDFIQKIKPKKTYLIHMTHDIDYFKLKKELPKGVLPAYDGLKIKL